MNTTSPIVAGGGWKRTRVERVKVKAWIALFAAIGLGSVAVVGAESAWVYACVPGGLSLLLSVVLFVRERPREFGFPYERAGHDPRNLYGACGSAGTTGGPPKAEPGAGPKDGGAKPVDDLDDPGQGRQR